MELTEHDQATLDLIYQDGGVFVTFLPDGSGHATTLMNREVSFFRVSRLRDAKKIEAVGDGLFPGTTQSYRVLA